MSRSNKDDIRSNHYCCENVSKDTLKLWLTHLKNEEADKQTYRLANSVTPFLAIPTTVVHIIFHICEEFKQPPDVRYLSVELFDRFMNNQFLMLTPKIWPENNGLFENRNWKEISGRIKEQSLLRVMSCIALASKFILFNKNQIVPIRKIQAFLHRCDTNFTIKTILASEMRVFKILGFKLHCPTILTSTDLLIELLNWPTYLEKQQLHDVKFKIIDLTYLHHQEIFHKLFYYSSGRWEKTNEERKEFLATECNNIFVAASVIVTCTMFLQAKEADSSSLSTLTSNALEKLTDIPSDDMIALASIIIMMVLK